MESRYLRSAQHHCKMCYNTDQAARIASIKIIKTFYFDLLSLLSMQNAIFNLERSGMDQDEKSRLIEKCQECNDYGKVKRHIEKFACSEKLIQNI